MPKDNSTLLVCKPFCEGHTSKQIFWTHTYLKYLGFSSIHLNPFDEFGHSYPDIRLGEGRVERRGMEGVLHSSASCNIVSN